MFDFLKKSFPKLNKESPFYIQAMSNIIVKPHDNYEPLDGKDVFIDGLFAGQIEKLPKLHVRNVMKLWKLNSGLMVQSICRLK